MKNYLLTFIILVALAVRTIAQKTGIGDQVPSTQIELLGTKTSKTLDIKDLKGKVVLLDFWATWCSPCIAGMPHLEALQREFGKKLKVIAISDEKKARLERFIKNRPHGFQFARAEDGLQETFHYRVIPHTVLIDAAGKVVAMTSPEKITYEVIKKAMAGEAIDLPIKKDYFNFDPKKDYFNANASTQNAFVLKPYLPGLPTFSKGYNKGAFKDRRRTVYNQNITGLFRMAYQMSSYRLLLEFEEKLVEWKNTKNRYCLDVIVAQPEKLYPTMQQQLAKNLPYSARIEKRKVKVVVIAQKKSGIKAPKSTPVKNYAGRGDGFSSKGATLNVFCNYLEGFGIFGLPVVNETGAKGAYKIDFEFDPESKDSFKKAMDKLGLTYSWQEREIPMLAISQKKH